MEVLSASFLIFLARMTDVSLGTFRILAISQRRRLLATFLGFIEIMIWLTAINQVVRNEMNVFYYLAYAGGFAMGNFMGILLEEKIAMGTSIIRIITEKDAHELLKALEQQGYGVTVIDAEGKLGKVKLIFTVVQRKNLEAIVNLVLQYNPKAFYSIQEVQSVEQGIFPVEHRRKRHLFDFTFMGRKAK